MLHILRTFFYEDVLKTIDEKYKDLVFSEFEKHFTYANIFETPQYYNLFSFCKNPDYKLYEKLHESKKYEIVKYLINEVYEDNYNPDLVLLLYGYITSITFQNMIDDYVNSNLKISNIHTKKARMRKYSNFSQKVEAQFYYERHYRKISKHKLDTSKIVVSEKSSEVIRNMIAKIYYFSYGKEVFLKGLNTFYKYQNKNYHSSRFIEIMIVKIKESITRSKKYSATTIFNTNKTILKDYLNKENKKWKRKEDVSSFYDLYEKIVKETAYLLNVISEKIYYKKKNDKEIMLLIK